MEVEIEEVIRVKMTCDECDGAGSVECWECGGLAVCYHCDAGKCPECEGSGFPPGQSACGDCDGKGFWMERI